MELRPLKDRIVVKKIKPSSEHVVSESEVAV